MDDQKRRGIGQRIREGERSFSFEFFPPKDAEGEEQLWRAIRELEPYRPTFVSVTYGAGGSSRDTTVRITGRIARETTLLPLGHLTCVGHTREELESILASYADAGVHNVLALRGDPEDGPRAEWTPTAGGFTYASELVELASGAFSVGVAAFPDGHPSSASLDHDAKVLLAKQRAGAEFAITDMVFRPADYFGLLERAEAQGVDIPILPGIMPITNFSQLRRFSEMCGAEIPRWLAKRLMAHGDDADSIRELGADVVAGLCRRLIEGGAPGIHFYTLNRARATLAVCERIGIGTP